MSKPRDKSIRSTASARQAGQPAATLTGPIEDEYRLGRVDYIAVPLVALVMGIWVFRHIWTAVNWDDLLYMSMARHTVPQAWILNRYGHIYLMKIFFFLAGDAINGGRVFWCLLFAGTCLLTYWCTRLLTGKKGYLLGGIAVLMVCMQPVFSKDAGCPLADFTVMFLAALQAFVYLQFVARRGRYAHLFIMLMGLIFFWATKSKEMGLCTAVFFVGLGRDQTGAFGFKRLTKDLGWAAAGVAAGSLVLMMFDWASMGDFWFSVRPSSIKGLLSRNVIMRPSGRNMSGRLRMSWYTFMTTKAVFVPFLLYLLTGWRSPVKEFGFREKVAWLCPIVLVILLTFIRMHFIIIPRYIVPAIPIMSIWAAQFMYFRFTGEPLYIKGRTRLPRLPLSLAAVLVAFLIALAVTSKVPQMAQHFRLNLLVAGFPHLKYNRLTAEQILYMLVIVPGAISVLLIVSIMSKKRKLLALFTSWLCFLVLACPAIAHNWNVLTSKSAQVMNNERKSKLRFEPLRAFRNEFKLDRDVRIFVSQDIHRRSWMLGRNPKANCHMFNIYFNAALDYDQVSYGGVDDIAKGGYTYALVTRADWQALDQKNKTQALMRRYELKTSREAVYVTRSGPMQIILLKRKAVPQGPLREGTGANSG